VPQIRRNERDRSNQPICTLRGLGGYIAFKMVRQAPDRIERLDLLDSPALPDIEDSQCSDCERHLE
jgi:pimeloyl-ACP methyl ester carboxylesterase